MAGRKNQGRKRGAETIYSSRWRALQAKAKAYYEGEPCWFCGGELDHTLPHRHPFAVEVHHLEARAFGGPVLVPLDQLRLAHKACNGADGARMKGQPRGRDTAKRGAMNGQAHLFGEAVFSGDARPSAYPSPSLSPTDAERSNREPPELPDFSQFVLERDGYNPPRLVTPADPTVTGSLGEDVVDWADRWLGLAMYPWQAFALGRILETRDDGSLRWPVAIVTVPRQSGKSTMMRALAAWRLFQGERWGEPQNILQVASNRAIAREIWAMSARQLSASTEAQVRYANGQEAVELPDTSKWIVGAANATAGPGLSLSLALVDEAWSVDEEVVTGGIAPTLLEREASQLLLISTAGESRSNLLRNFRESAIAQMDDPEAADVLLLEWSAAPEADPDDPEAWRQASPLWTPERAKRVATQHRIMETNTFRMQLLNQWVANASAWITDRAWSEAADPTVALPTRATNPGTIAIETAVDGLPIGAVLAVSDDEGRVIVRAHVEHSMRGLWAWLETQAKERRGVTILHHSTVRVPEVPGTNLVPVKASDQVAGFGPTKAAIESGDLIHDGNPALWEQVLMASVYRSGDGHSMLSQKASEGAIFLARALVWAVGRELAPSTRSRHLVVAAA